MRGASPAMKDQQWASRRHKIELSGGSPVVPSNRSRFGVLLLAAVSALAVPAPWLPAGEVKLKNGVTLNGSVHPVEMLVKAPQRPNNLPTTSTPILMVQTPLARTFVPYRQRVSSSDELDLGRGESFKFNQKKMDGGTRLIGVVGDFVEKPTAFDAFGRRALKLRLAKSIETIYQGITEITPEFVKITALNYQWDTAMATSSLPDDVLDPILRQGHPPTDSSHRIKIALFYIGAARYGPAERELDSIDRDFPQMADSVKKARAHLMAAKARDVLGEIKLRRAAGQHQFVYQSCAAFLPENVEPAVLAEVREITAAYDAARDRGIRARGLLADLQAQLGTDPRVADVGSRRAEIVESMNFSNIDRLDAFLRLADDSKLKADEKLALALSGWVVGSDHAITELDQALKFWQARYLLLDSLGNAEAGRDDVRKRLEALEGVSVPRVAQMIPLLPAALDSGSALPATAVRITLPAAGDEPPAAYWVMLPPEYHVDHSYPLIVALHSEKRPPEQELAFWAGSATRIGPAQRHGYIVIVPDYTAKPGQRQYEYAAASHRLVLEALRDARRRFNVDSDRVFLAGHDMGGDAAFDIGLSHPDLFAGVIPIAGLSDRYSEFYWENAKTLPFYVILGEYDRNTVSNNAKELMKMMQNGFDLIYVEYIGTGADSFYSEIHKLFDWMSRLKRAPLPRNINDKSLRECDNQFYWLEFNGLPKNVIDIDWSADKRRPIRPINVSARVNEANTVAISFAAERYRIRLTPTDGLIDFEKRFRVKIHEKEHFNGFLKPDIGAMLDHHRLHGDRQRLYWAVLEL